VLYSVLLVQTDLLFVAFNSSILFCAVYFLLVKSCVEKFDTT